ncbi:MAG: TrmB family transcriptional regulator [Deltaproteobacteria bacterium]|nr:TrmB family transcriptional regulator [Deltaproteobacteria bacterium]
MGRQNILGLSQSEISTYLTLLGHNPANGSQLSRLSGVRRPNIYDVLRSLRQKGLVVELKGGLYAPLAPDEFLKRIRFKVDVELASLKERIQAVTKKSSTEYVWTIRGYDEVMAKAKEMICSAKEELYVLLYQEEAKHLDPYLLEAEQRGVEVKYVSMGPPLNRFKLQVVHPKMEKMHISHGGRVFDIVRDKIEILVGMFEQGRENDSAINWAKNHWFVMAIREGIRHDFFHYFIHKILDQGEKLTDHERKIYDIIKDDAWSGRF